MLIQDGKRIDPPKAFLNAFKKPVTFELHVSQTPTSHITGKRSFPRSRGIEPFYQMAVEDKEFGQKLVIFRYAETQRVSNRGGLQEFIHTPTEIEFLSKGNIVCDPTVLSHIELYYWMSLHPQNASSPNFDPKKGAIFYQINPEKDAKERLDAEGKELESRELILKTWKLSDLREVALELGDINAMDKEEFMLRDYLMQVMKRNPVIFYARATGEKMKQRAEITEAVGYGIIQFDPKDRVWSWGKDEPQQVSQICVCMNNEDEKDRLIRYFSTATREDNIDWFNERLAEERKNKVKKLETA